MVIIIHRFTIIIWLVVSTPLKNMSQIGSSSQLLGKIKNVSNHQPVIDIKTERARVPHMSKIRFQQDKVRVPVTLRSVEWETPMKKKILETVCRWRINHKRSNMGMVKIDHSQQIQGRNPQIAKLVQITPITLGLKVMENRTDIPITHKTIL